MDAREGVGEMGGGYEDYRDMVDIGIGWKFGFGRRLPVRWPLMFDEVDVYHMN
jgi:hypothetical protein